MTTSASTFIHLGMPKTASTSIRFNLFEQHSQTHYLGKFIGGEFPPAIRPVILERWKIPSQTLAPDDILSESISNQLTYATEHNLQPILSKESLAGGSLLKKQVQASRFKKFFGECRIILFVREPVSFLNSYYVQMLRVFQETPSRRRLRWMNTLGHPPRYFDINEWMKATWGAINSPRNYISYADTAKAYATVFGQENVRMFIFEEFVRNPETFITKLCDYVGIDPQEGFALMDGKRSNERLTTHYIDRIQEIERSPDLTTQFRQTSKEERRKLLEPADRSGEKIDPKLSGKWLKKINGVGDKQNRRLVDEWGLPLADYGYRV